MKLFQSFETKASDEPGETCGAGKSGGISSESSNRVKLLKLINLVKLVNSFSHYFYNFYNFNIMHPPGCILVFVLALWLGGE